MQELSLTCNINNCNIHQYLEKLTGRMLTLCGEETGALFAAMKFTVKHDLFAQVFVSGF